MTTLEFIRSVDPSSVLLWVLIALVVLVVWSWHRSDDDFDLRQCLQDNVTGKISVEKVGYVSVLGTSMWGFVTLVQRDKLTDWYVGAMIGGFVLGRAVSSGLSVLKDIKSSPKYDQGDHNELAQNPDRVRRQV